MCRFGLGLCQSSTLLCGYAQVFPQGFYTLSAFIIGPALKTAARSARSELIPEQKNSGEFSKLPAVFKPTLGGFNNLLKTPSAFQESRPRFLCSVGVARAGFQHSQRRGFRLYKPI